ncbi:MAG: hypothetical protein GY851_29480 [bacterium]|nr:hypothetical protein [bacterium]
MSADRTPVEIEPMVFRLSPGNRRAARLVALGMAALLGLVWTIMRLAGEPGPGPAFIATAMACPVLLCAWLEYWRLCVDGAGVHRRTLLRWAHWPWEDFMLGRVHREEGLHTFTFSKEAVGKGSLVPLFSRKTMRRACLNSSTNFGFRPPCPICLPNWHFAWVAED